jgi:hypothetical protein
MATHTGPVLSYHHDRTAPVIYFGNSLLMDVLVHLQITTQHVTIVTVDEPSPPCQADNRENQINIHFIEPRF